MEEIDNRLLRKELDYDVQILQQEYLMLIDRLNEEQRKIYDIVSDAVNKKKGGLFFVHRYGGMDKTYLWKIIISKIKSNGKIVLIVASSEIASLLLSDGWTAHSKFKISIQVVAYSICKIKKGTQLTKLIESTSLIVWDEAPMNHRNYFEALDKFLKDILQNGDSVTLKKPFRGKVVLLGRDFRQNLSIVVGENRTDTVDASISQSYLWNYCTIFYITKNMRLLNDAMDEESRMSLMNFGK